MPNAKKGEASNKLKEKQNENPAHK